MRCPNLPSKSRAFTLVEILFSMAIFSVAAASIFSTWIGLQSMAVNATTYAQRQSDQMRVIDYLKRDIRRATALAIYDGSTPVTGNGIGNEIRLTLPKYYTDSGAEDDAPAGQQMNAPTLDNSGVTYGSTLNVRYYVTANGAIVRDEAGAVRTVGDPAAAFTLSVSKDPTGLIRCRVFFNQPMRGGVGRTFRREVNVLCGQRAQLQT